MSLWKVFLGFREVSDVLYGSARKWRVWRYCKFWRFQRYSEGFWRWKFQMKGYFPSSLSYRYRVQGSNQVSGSSCTAGSGNRQTNEVFETSNVLVGGLSYFSRISDYLGQQPRSYELHEGRQDVVRCLWWCLCGPDNWWPCESLGRWNCWGW